MEAVLAERSPAVRIDGRPVVTNTRVVSAGGYVLTLSTVLPDRGVELHSTYTGHPHAERTLVSEIFLTPHRPPLVEAREANPVELPVLYERGSCLYDHLLRLHELLSALGFGRVSIDELDGALFVLKP